MGVEEEIANNRQNIRSDGYAMSIGEVLNLYKDEEIRIRPEFQRLFRWPIEKQSKLIESILLDIPLPPIFVSQSEDSVWEVVDGLQRLSTILKFVGELRDEETGNLQDPSALTRTKYIPSLEGVAYAELPQAVKLQFKRARLDFRILLKESDDSVKYELFDRLNSGGMRTSPQEVRTAILIMNNPTLYASLQAIRDEQVVVDTLALTDRQIDEQYDLELLVRYCVFQSSSREELSSFSDIDTYLTDKLLELAKRTPEELQPLLDNVKQVFEVAASFGPSAFRKYDGTRGRSTGGFSVSTFEAVTAGISRHLAGWLTVPEAQREQLLRRCLQKLWEDEQFRKNSGAGVRATTRAPRMPEVGARIFNPA